MKSKLLLVFISGLMVFAHTPTNAQTCTAPNNNQSQNYNGNGWYAFFYRNEDLTSYHGRVTLGSGTYGSFDDNFTAGWTTGSYDPDWDGDASANTFNCVLPAETFSVRLRQRRSWTAGMYNFTVGADDGVRLYIDNVLIIDEWQAQVYATFTMPYYMSSGNHDIVIEYYEQTGSQRLSYSVANNACNPGAVPTTYGTNNVWKAYYFDGKNFDTYRGTNNVGTATSPMINTNFGGDNVNITGLACSPLLTETFSVRYRLTKTFNTGTYLFTAGGDDGYRLSIDGGATWLINNWSDHGYGTTAATHKFTTNTTVNMVLEYYENHSGNQVYFDVGVALPVSLVKFEGRFTNSESNLNWITTPESTEDRFIVERSTDGRQFNGIGTVPASAAIPGVDGNRQYSFRDPSPVATSAFYRLKIIDRNGPEKYSGIITINPKASVIAKIYPTLIDQNKQLFIQTDRSTADMEVVIRSISGQQVFIKKLGAMARGQIATLQLQDAPLSRGSYMVQVLAGGAVMHKQMIMIP